MAAKRHRLAAAGSIAAAAALWVALGAQAAPPAVPTSLPYQGLLLDGLGQPRTGSVDLVVRVYDAVSGGTLVYKQSFPSVALADGVFTVQLGPTGEGTDSPANPLTTDLATALAGDAGITAPVRFLEVTVGTDGPLTRSQILSSAYAIRAASAATADSATTAATAATADEAANVAGVSGLYVSEFFEQFNADGGGPPNYDPSEGVADTDGDGILNFVDPDNDGDAIADASESAGGINLQNPNATAITPASAFAFIATTVHVTGSLFQAPLTVAFGSQSPAPTNVTATGFDVVVGPQTIGSKQVVVTNANGQSDTTPLAFSFANSISGLPLASASQSLSLAPGLSSFAYGGTMPNYYYQGPGIQVTSTLFSAGSNGQMAIALDASAALAGARCRMITAGVSCSVEVLRDSDGDGNLGEEAGAPIELLTGDPTTLAMELRYDPSGRPAVFYIARDATSRPTVAHDLNGDGDFADANERLALETIGDSTPVPAALAIDSAGRVGAAYYAASAAAIRLAHDRNGDGDFADASELSSAVPALAQPKCVGLAFDASNRPAVITASGTTATLYRDLNADGDFADAGESLVVVSGGGNVGGCDVAGNAVQPLTIATATSNNFTVRSDKNGDGDFADAGEATVIAASNNVLDLELDGTTHAVAADALGVLTRVPTD